VDADCWSLRGTTLLPPEETEHDTGLISYFDQIFPESKCFIYKMAALSFFLLSFLSFGATAPSGPGPHHSRGF
jgi:hypothetical protein